MYTTNHLPAMDRHFGLELANLPRYDRYVSTNTVGTHRLQSFS